MVKVFGGGYFLMPIAIATANVEIESSHFVQNVEVPGGGW